MITLQHLAEWVISIVQIIVLASLGYHYLLLLGSIRAKKQELSNFARPSFAVVIPAHNEEAVIAKSVTSLLSQDYPLELVDVYVIADHCADCTAAVARGAGAIVLERDQGARGQKAFALKWGLDLILGDPRLYDAVAIFDADSLVDPHCLAAFAPFIAQGYRALQGQKTIVNASDTPFTGLDDVNHRLADLLRARAKTNLGFSARLMGDCMCFHTELLKQYGWPTKSLVEDREFGLYLILHGISVMYVPDAKSAGEAAHRWKDATAQRLRWVGGGQSIGRAYAGKFLIALLKGPRLALLDQFLELILPPFTISLTMSFVLIVSLVVFPNLRPLLNLGLSVVVFFLWCIYPVLGLIVAGAPAKSLFSLWRGPLYVAWRLAVAIRTRLAPKSVTWVRTKRSSE